jgi:hypothetical protein
MGRKQPLVSQLQFTTELYSCDLSKPPTFEWENSKGIAYYQKEIFTLYSLSNMHLALRSVCILCSDLSNIQAIASLPRKMKLSDPSREYIEVHYKLKMTIESEVSPWNSIKLLC